MNGASRRVSKEFCKRPRQRRSVARGHQKTAAGRVDQLGKRAVRGQHHRHAASKRFEHVDPFRLRMNGRDAHHVDAIEQL